MDSSAKWLDAKQAGKHLGRHPETMRKNARLGKIPAHFFNNAWFFDQAELDNFLKTGNNSPKQGARQGVKKCHVNRYNSRNEVVSRITRSRHQAVSEYVNLLKPAVKPRHKN